MPAVVKAAADKRPLHALTFATSHHRRPAILIRDGWLFVTRFHCHLSTARLAMAALLTMATLTVATRKAQAQTNEFIPLLPKWDRSFDLRASSGYNDNLLLSRAHQEASAFINSGLDFTLFRLPLDGKEFTLFLSSDYTWYPQGKQINHEQFGVALSRFKLDLTPVWNAGLDLQYIYQDQVIDTSLTETNLARTLVRGHGITVRPSLRRELPNGFWAEANANISRQFFKAPLDDYWEGGPQLRVGRDYGFKSSVSLGYHGTLRAYDTREQIAIEGAAMPGTSLGFMQNELESALRHNFDEERHWRSVTRLGVLWNNDNGSGYFNFVRYQVSEQLRYVAKTWEFKASAKFSHYDFTRQFAPSLGTSRRERDFLGFSLRGEKKLLPNLKFFTDFGHERSLSNLVTDEYTLNKVSVGIDLEF